MRTRNTARRDRFRRTIAKDRPECHHHCGNPIDYKANHLHPRSFTIDHLIPIAKGGPDTLDNCVPSCRQCNQAKGDKLPTHVDRGVTFVTERTW